MGRGLRGIVLDCGIQRGASLPWMSVRSNFSLPGTDSKLSLVVLLLNHSLLIHEDLNDLDWLIFCRTLVNQNSAVSVTLKLYFLSA